MHGERNDITADPVGATGSRTADLFTAIILDRSGSMASIRSDVIGAFNGFIEDQRAEEGQTIVTLTQFDSDSIDVVLESVNVGEVPPLTRETFRPRGGTPLYDAIGLTLERTERHLDAIGWDGVVLVTIITDGRENASREWTGARVSERVKELEARGWGFMYLGAHPHAYDEARAVGVSTGSVLAFEPSADGVADMYYSWTAASRRFRGGETRADDLIGDADGAEDQPAPSPVLVGPNPWRR